MARPLGHAALQRAWPYIHGEALPRYLWGRHGGTNVRDLAELPRTQRARMSRRATAAAAIALIGTNCAIGIETFLLVQLAYNGSQLTLEGTVGAPNFPAVLTGIIVGTLTNMLFGVLLIKPQVDWFVSGIPADRARRAAIRHIPRNQVIATLAAWTTAVGSYAVVADDPSSSRTAGVAAAFLLAAMSSSCITYLFAERAARPLAVVAFRDFPARHVFHGVRSRMIAVWLVSSAVPMFGLLLLNLGRWLDMLPPVSGPVDWTIIILGVVALVAGIRVITLVGRSIADPLSDLHHAVTRVDAADYTVRVPVYDSSELGVLQHGFNTMVIGLEERERMRQLFARHVGDTVAAQALEHGEGMRGVNATVGVLFVDIIDSTGMAARQDPRVTAELLNDFFTIVADVVDGHHGFVNKFEGDSALAIFGAPVELDDPATSVLSAARDLADRLEDELDIGWGMGISYGTVFAGNIGAETRYEYTVIGDAVNESARLSDLAKQSGSSVMASGAALACATDDEAGEWIPVGTRSLRGRSEPTQVFAPRSIATRPPGISIGTVVAGLLRPARRVTGQL
ncbi:adenylate/guanylate cyclase domain-containing protein [Gordonia sp. Z-3]|jgi:adenylate cyclase|uniref:adenylate/guanylate cyclase domain-containing protein n=1 Tax=Gordonia sp. Z-3 TaxID=3115408 RepID=UPI003FA5DB69